MGSNHRPAPSIGRSAAWLALGACLGALALQISGLRGGQPDSGGDGSGFSTAAAPVRCEMAIVGGGVGGLHFAIQLLDHGVFKPEDLCIFERGLKFAGRVDDFRWTDVGGNLEPVGLGGWRIDMDNNPRVWKHAVERYNMTLRRWQVATKYREARGIITGVDKLGELKRAYPLFAASPNGNRSVLADLLLEFPPTDESTVQLRQYMDMYDLLLSRYGSEALAYIKDVEFGGFTTLLHSTDPRWTLDMFRMWGGGGQARHYRPVGGGIGEVARLMAEELSQRGVSKMSVAMGITKANRCSKADRKMSGFSKKNGCYRLETWRGSTVFAKHVAFAVPPLALRKIKGDVVADLLATPLLENALPEPAFKAALLFPYAWWEPYLHANETSGFLDAISGSGNCLGQIVPYMGRGSNGEAAIHVAYMAGECVDGHWAHLFHSNGPSEAEWKAHLMRQLKVLFPGFEVPEPLQVVTKYWEEGAWHMQRKTDPYLTSLQILKLSTNPLPGEDVYLINEAFGLRRGWMEASFESAEAVLRVRFLNDTSSWSEGDYVEIEGKVVGGSDRVEIQGDISSIVKSTPPFPFDFTIQPGPFVARKPLVRQPGACTTK